MNLAFQRYHQYECEIIDELLTSGLVHIVVRMFFEGLFSFNGSINEMEKFIQSHQLPTTKFDFDSTDANFNRKLFLSTIQLVRDDGSSPLLKFEKAEYEKLFLKTSKLKKLWSSNVGFIQRILSILATVGKYFVHGVGGWSLKKDETDGPRNPSCHQQLIGNACYLFSSMLNHSCAPNIKRINVGNRVVIFVSRDIEKGGQLFDSYRPNFNNQPRIERQESLLKDYGFNCECEACTNDWPLNENLLIYNEELLEYAWSAHENLPFMSPTAARRNLQDFVEAVSKNQKDFPSAELVVLQECISNCLLLITRPLIQF